MSKKPLYFNVFPFGALAPDGRCRGRQWHSRGQRFDPAYLHQQHSISLEIECCSILFSPFCAGHFRLGQQMDNRPSQFLLSYCRKEEVMASIKFESACADRPRQRRPAPPPASHRRRGDLPGGKCVGQGAHRRGYRRFDAGAGRHRQRHRSQGRERQV